MIPSETPPRDGVSGSSGKGRWSHSSIPLHECGKCRVKKGGYRSGGCKRFLGRRGWKGGGWGGCRIRLCQGYGVTRKVGAEFSALLFSRGGIFCCALLVCAKRVDVVGVSGDFGEGAGAVGGDEGVAEVLEEGDVVGGGSGFAKATA